MYFRMLIELNIIQYKTRINSFIIINVPACKYCGIRIVIEKDSTSDLNFKG